jgi:hypothetical protein
MDPAMLADAVADGGVVMIQEISDLDQGQRALQNSSVIEFPAGADGLSATPVASHFVDCRPVGSGYDGHECLQGKPDLHY